MISAQGDHHRHHHHYHHQPQLPGSADTFEYGDSVVVVTTNEQLADLRDIFA